jgi:hypothetical protein
MGAFWWHTFRATVISFRLFALNVETQQCYVTHYPIGLPTLRPSWCNLWFSNFGDFGNPGSPERQSLACWGGIMAILAISDRFVSGRRLNRAGRML